MSHIPKYAFWKNMINLIHGNFPTIRYLAFQGQIF